MSYIEWTPDLSVGIEYLDGQHQKLFEMINEYYESLRDDASPDGLEKFLLGLEKYAFIHFTSEERNMSLYQFEGYEAHKKEHKLFIDYIEQKLKDLKTGKKVFGIEVTNFLKDWLKQHVSGTDKLYTTTFVSHGLK